ncbi:MAG TPA: hypothetical protein PKL35_08720, partial [Methanoregulaceae archaeon]|nr:hypothetical protein [Methanoregulaceae archaeon]
PQRIPARRLAKTCSVKLIMGAFIRLPPGRIHERATIGILLRGSRNVGDTCWIRLLQEINVWIYR